MAIGADLQELDVVVRCRKGIYIAKMPQIGLYATASSLPKAVEALDQKREQLKDELKEADALEEIDVSPAMQPGQAGIAPGLILFAAKAIIVLLMVLVTASLAASYADRTWDRRMQELNQLAIRLKDSTKVGGEAFWAKIETNIKRAASSSGDLPEERKKELLSDLHIIVERWRPFVREAQTLFSETERQPPADK